MACAVAGGLQEHSNWGRIPATVVAFLSLIRFPLGAVLDVWTQVVPLGCRNRTLYNQF